VVVFGYVVRLVAQAVWADATTGTAAEGFISRLLDGWVLILGENAEIITNVAFVTAIAGALAVTVVKGWWQVAVLIPTIYLGVLVWENRLVFQPGLTRQLVFGALLVIMMAVRPQGLLGKKRAEIT